MTAYYIDFEPVGRRGKCPAGQSLLDCARQLGVEIVSICGGYGLYGCCKVQLLSGSLSGPTSIEQETFSAQELEEGYRLACQAYPASDCKLRVPPESMAAPQRTQVEGLETAVAADPPVRAYRLQIPPPSLSDLLADSERLLATLEQQHQVCCRILDINVLRGLSPRLRSCNWQVQVSVRSDELVAVSPPDSRHLGLAVDLGSTKIAGYLVDLERGRTLAARGIMNPQISYGEDIVTRIARSMESPSEAARIQESAVEALSQLAVDLCTEVKAEPEEIVEAVVVGNTAMHHLFLGLPVRQLASSPFVPAVSGALHIRARGLGLHIAAGAYVYLLPSIAGFVGADHVAMLLATEAWRAEGVVVALDIGTNTEISLVTNGKIATVSCASGPAFEGGHIKDGMRAASGAIERLRITDDTVQYQTIDDAPPVGICGSGALDAIAQLHLAGVIDQSGRMQDSHPRVRLRPQPEFVLVGEEEHNGHSAIVITQQDIRELQLAKAAIRSGIQVLLETAGCVEEEINQVIVAGAFGSYIDVSSAVAIGMLPSLPLDRFRQVGNAAGMGAKLALVSRGKRAEAERIASQVSYIELATAADFMQTFTEASHIGRYRMRHGKREAID